jgi:tripartite-type tricarboxylate transporter receptor subunit TctC
MRFMAASISLLVEKKVGVAKSLGVGTAVVCVALVSGLAWMPAALGQAYPVKPVRVILPFPPGGDVGGATRFATTHLEKALGQPFVIESRPGANTLIGAEAVAKSAPDGYTLFICGPSTFAINPTLYGAQLPYDYARDFTPISIISSTPYFITVPASLPVKTIADLLALAKSEQGKLSYVTSGNGSSNHLAYEILSRAAGVRMIHITYKGGMQAGMTDLISGRVTTMMAGLAVVGANVRSGKLRAIAVTSASRSALMPELPTIAESGWPGFDIIAWFALFAPSKTPPDVVARINGELRKYLSSSEAKEDYLKLGHEAVGSTIEQLAALVKSDTAKYDRVIREANIKLE